MLLNLWNQIVDISVTRKIIKSWYCALFHYWKCLAEKYQKKMSSYAKLKFQERLGILLEICTEGLHGYFETKRN